MDYKTWESRIIEAIQHISDVEYQKASWFGKSKDVSSFAEIINVLYDDLLFEAFLEGSKVENTDVLNGLKRLNNLINDYDEPSDDLLIINDPKWIVITEQAQKVLLDWGNK